MKIDLQKLVGQVPANESGFKKKMRFELATEKWTH
jgi:hypothetical protein